MNTCDGCLVNSIFMRRGALWEHESSVANFGSVPVTCETPRKHRKNKRVFAPITRYRDTTEEAACLYFRISRRNQINHIITQQHMGSDEDSNLCLCCLRCNLKKGPNIASTDPEAGSAYRIVLLFHPRKQRCW